MGLRREGREAAIQILYSVDAGNRDDFDEGRDRFWSLHTAKAKVRGRGEELAQAVIGRMEEIDDTISRSTANYQLDRLSVVDRNILRLAVYEMLFEEEVPNPVAINEAIEIAKGFGTPESGRFVNGVLDRVRRDLEGQGPTGTDG